ncbi:major facilitator superfamily MFS_1 [Catenulispora acidiphila DSM 44928]|uniref:Major facilitator superfamily MFS_1 n=1 Tax=Catenulispora acidiphila (strain DSM 44928 / JCM 14897 / NBRC 102108 / NRRL B-24433 / ID139908) TaxID=479433 RepID=C7QKJ0_CATAD|nr:MFS transporter [Catenulispora acidiphila]ACU77089.1 major facilitator superfamily MFS_1 [Catenulispora acidiphila DSM 44928]
MTTTTIRSEAATPASDALGIAALPDQPRPAQPSASRPSRQSRPSRSRAPLSVFAGFPRAIWVVFAGTVVNRVGFLVGPFLVFFLGSRGIPSSQTPYVLGALGAGNLVGPAVGGWLADRHSRKLTMLAGLLGTAAAQGALFAAPNVATMALAAIALSATATMVSPAASAILTDDVGPARRREAFALIGWAVNIGTAVAGVLGGYLAAHGYWMLFAIDAGTSLGYAVIVAMLLPADRTRHDASQTPESLTSASQTLAAQSSDSPTSAATPTSSGYGIVFRDRLTRRLLILFAVQLFIYSLTESALPLAIRTDGLSPTVMGLAAAVNAGLVVALQPLATTLVSRFPRTQVFLTGGILTTTGIALTGLAHTPTAYAATVTIWSLGEVIIGGIPASLIANLAPATARGRYQGAFSWAWGVSRFLALAAGTTAFTLISPAFLWWTALLAGTAANIGIMLLSPAIDRRTSAIDEPATR